MQKTEVSQIIEARWVLPVVPRETVYEHYAVVINHTDVIDICPITTARERYTSQQVTTLDQHVLMPGLVNLHTHAAMTLFRGLADGLPLQSWLAQHIWPAEAKLVSSDFVYDASLLSGAEMLQSGITTFNDMYFFPSSTIEAMLKCGLRVNAGLVVIDFPTQYANDADDYIKKGLDVRDQFRNEPTVTFSFAPHAPYTVSDETFENIVTLAHQVNIGIHSHIHETKQELADSNQQYGLRPLSRLANLGVLGPNVTLAHGVHVDESEIELLAEFGCSIAHCPSSNLKLASGIAPVHEYLKKGVNVGLGSDGAASNNRQDVFTEMRLAALLAAGNSYDATAVSAFQAIEMATINGARALGLSDKIGTIEKGKLADLTAIELVGVETQPCFNPASHLVYVAGREHVSHTWVNGTLKYHRPNNERHGYFSDIEPNELTGIINKWQPIVSEYT